MLSLVYDFILTYSGVVIGRIGVAGAGHGLVDEDPWLCVSVKVRGRLFEHDLRSV